MSYRERLPKWFSEDGNVLAINEETEEIKINSYHDFERRYVKQPMQIWMKFKPKTYTFTGTNTIPIDITGSYPSMFNFTFQAENDITEDIEISDGTNTIKVFTEIPAGHTFELSPQGRVKVDGKEIQKITDQEQPIADIDIPFGVINGNRKLMQIFSPQNPDLLGIEIKFSRIVGAQDGLTIELYELDEELNLNIKIDEYYLRNDNLRQVTSGFFNIVIPFVETLDVTKKYAFIIKRRSAHSNREYFVLRGAESGQETLKYWDGDEWKSSPNILYYRTLSPVTAGNLPIVNPPIGEITTNVPDELTCVTDNLEFDKIYARSTAHPVYPLKRMSVYLDDGTLLKEKEFKKKLHQYCYVMSITAEEIATLGIEIEKLPFKVYLETEWWYFEHSIKKGFPQSSTDEDEKYWPNEKLDLHAEVYGLFRRKYRDDILPYEYIDTYPIGYPFPEEQDFMLEERILEEYATRTDVNKIIYLYDPTGQTRLVALRSKIPGINTIEVYTYINDLDEERVNITLTTREKEIVTEDYLFTDSITFTDEINDTSQILMAKYLNNATSLLLYNIEYINTEGVYPTYGLISSEIYSYLGVIPTIKDMVDYCLVYDRRSFDNYLWSGNIFSPAIFRVDIPRPPSNFKWLTHEEIKTIIKRCKKVGTEIISAYTVESKVGLNLSIGMEPSETIIRNDLNLGIEVEVGDALANLYTPITIDMTEMEVKSILPLSFDISLETQISSISELFSQDTDTEFSVNCFKDTKINGSGTEAYIDLNNSAILDTGYKHATVAQDLPRTDGTLGWTGLDTIAIDNRYIIGQTNTTGSNKSTRLLSTFGFGHNIPSDAFITGIKVLIAADSSQPGGTTAYCRIKTNTETSDTKTANAPQGWSQVTFGSNTAIWGLNARGSNVNGDNLRVELYFDPINNNHRVQIDWVNIEFFYRKGSGSFTTQKIVLV